MEFRDVETAQAGPLRPRTARARAGATSIEAQPWLVVLLGAMSVVTVFRYQIFNGFGQHY